MKKVCNVFSLFLSAFLILLLGQSFVALTPNSAVYDYSFSATEIAPLATRTESVSFSRREYEYIELADGFPLYSGESSLENSCGATAGAEVVAFYDRYFENLIPNYSAFYSPIGIYLLKDRTYIPTLMNELYTLMRTNIDDEGVSEYDCLNGLKSYVRGKGQEMSYSSVRSSSFINETAYLVAINSNQPVLLFNVSTDVAEFSIKETSETIVYTRVEQNHIFVGYGYYKVKYYNSSGVNFRTDVYIRAASNLLGLTNGYIRISSTTSTLTSNSWSISAYSINIS